MPAYSVAYRNVQLHFISGVHMRRYVVYYGGFWVDCEHLFFESNFVQYVIDLSSICFEVY